MTEKKIVENTSTETKKEVNEKDLKDVAGGHVKDLDSTWYCPKCGRYEYDIYNKYCNYCGYRG